MSDAYQKKLPAPSEAYVVDFFSGCGGMSWGFANTRQSHMAYRVLAGLDIDGKALSTYERNVGSPGIEKDIREVAENPSELADVVPALKENPDRPLVFVGCAPCQGFSAHRKKDDRDDPRNNLLVAFAKICAHWEPDVLVMENVSQIFTGRYKEYFEAAEAQFEEAGYLLTKDVLDLSLYGVPQRRKRAFVIGSRGERISLPQPIFSKEAAPTVRDAIAHLDPIESGETDSNDEMHRAPNHTERILERIRKTPPDGGDRRALKDEDQLDCHTSVDNGDTPGFTDVYGRLRWDEPSVTITAKSSTPSCGRFLHPQQHRNISVREAAILQGFPQAWQFEGSFTHRYRQIGEAVPPLFARFLAWEILEHLSPGTNRVPSLPKPSARRSREGDYTNGYVGATESDGTHSLKVVDCFCGSGGLSLGFEAAGYDTAFAFDTDEDSVATFAQNFSSRKAEVADVREVEDVTQKISEQVGDDPFVLAGGPPCQGFSQQRRGEDKDPRNNLILRFAELVDELPRKPEAVVLENVTYLDSPRGEKVLNNYLFTLRTAGYTVFRHDLNSADFGVSQLRKRIFIVALRGGVGERYEGPEPLTPDRWVTVGEAFSGLPEFVGQEPVSPTLPFLTNHEPSNEGDLNKRRIAFVDMGGGRLWIPEHLQLNCHRKYGGHLDVYGRLDWFSQARTITGGFDSFTRGEFGHPFLHRSITPREGARLQGFPDWFSFEGNRASLRSQIGNAVPPPMAYAVAKAVRRAISTEKKEIIQKKEAVPA